MNEFLLPEIRVDFLHRHLVGSLSLFFKSFIIFTTLAISQHNIRQTVNQNYYCFVVGRCLTEQFFSHLFHILYMWGILFQMKLYWHSSKIKNFFILNLLFSIFLLSLIFLPVDSDSYFLSEHQEMPPWNSVTVTNKQLSIVTFKRSKQYKDTNVLKTRT